MLYYIPPDSNLKSAQQMYEFNSIQMKKQSDNIFIAGGDFNQTYLKTVVPNFHEYVHTSTRENIP